MIIFYTNKTLNGAPCFEVILRYNESRRTEPPRQTNLADQSRALFILVTKLPKQTRDTKASASVVLTSCL